MRSASVLHALDLTMSLLPRSKTTFLQIRRISYCLLEKLTFFRSTDEAAAKLGELIVTIEQF